MDVRGDPGRDLRVAGGVRICRVGPRSLFLLPNRGNASRVRSGRSRCAATGRRGRRILKALENIGVGT